MDKKTKQAIVDVVSDFPGCLRSAAAFIVRLNQSPGRYVGYDDLATAVEDAVGGQDTRAWIGSKAKHARKAIEGHGLILNAYGLGYMIIRDGTSTGAIGGRGGGIISGELSGAATV